MTGGNSGIGKGIAAALAADGHRVTIACRTMSKAEQAVSEMTGDIDVKYLDLADLSSVAAFADSVQSVDVLINNAAVFGIPLSRTVDGFESPHGHQPSRSLCLDVTTGAQNHRQGRLRGE